MSEGCLKLGLPTSVLKAVWKLTSIHVLMVEVIKAEISKALANKFRKKAMEVYGYKRGAVKAAIEDLLRRFVFPGKTNWKILKGCIKSELISVELQHVIWKRID